MRRNHRTASVGIGGRHQSEWVDGIRRNPHHTEHGDSEGLLYVSRLTGEDIYAVFDRGVGKLDSVETGALAHHLRLPEVLEQHQIGLIF